MYYLSGLPVPRVPGHCTVEVYNEEAKEPKPMAIDDNKYQTNEYIHPVCHYRDVCRGPEPSSALKDFTRSFEPNFPGAKEGRFWWQRKGDEKRIPEWMILEDVSPGEINFERHWYQQCEVTKEKAEKLKKAGYTKDFLQTLDDKNDFKIGKKEGWLYP
jgi:hypothetical protein